jgi:hypothetical protein
MGRPRERGASRAQRRGESGGLPAQARTEVQHAGSQSLTREPSPNQPGGLGDGTGPRPLFYEKVPVIGYGDLFGLRAARKTVTGFDEKTDRPRFYNVWLER